MPDDTTIKATIATLTASGLDVNTTTVRGVAVVVVTDRQTGERYIHRDADPWAALVRAAESAGFTFVAGSDSREDLNPVEGRSAWVHDLRYGAPSCKTNRSSE